MRRIITSLLLACAGSVAPANAHVDTLVVTRDSSTFYPGGGGIPLVLPAGQTLRYQNLDTFQPHNVYSVERSQDGSRLFMSPTMATWNLGRGVAPVAVAGTEQLSPGAYDFYCDIHPLMRGTLTVL